MGAKEWREAAETFNKKYSMPGELSYFELCDRAETKLIEFMASDEWKATRALLHIWMQKIDLGVLYEDREIRKIRRYFLGQHGLSYLLASEIDCFEATARDAVSAFYGTREHRKLNISMVDWIKEQLDIMAKQVLNLATSR